MHERQSDIEIYVRDVQVEEIVRWVERTVGEVHLRDKQDGIHCYVVRGPAVVDEIAMTVTSGVEDGPFTSIWFNPNRTPWDTDTACARQAANGLGGEIRCDPGPDVPHPALFLRIIGDVEDLVNWDDDFDRPDSRRRKP